MSTSTGNAGIESDDFAEGSLDSTWVKTRETGGASVTFEGAGTADARCNLSVPNANFSLTDALALRVLQNATDDDFQVEVKLETVPTEKSTAGIWIQDEDRSTGPTSDLVWLFAEGRLGGDTELWGMTVTGLEVNSTDIEDLGAGASAPIWLRIDRTGDVWTFEYSLNGTGWNVIGDGETFAMTVASVGFFQANIEPDYSEDTSKFDYFFENSARIDPEDPTGRRVMVIS